MTDLMFTFPGQGAQKPGMLLNIPGRIMLLEEVSDILHEDASQLDSAIALKHTRSVQLCLLISGVAYARELMSAQIIPHMVAGLSIGAYASAVVAGSLSFFDAVRIVALRGSLMEQAYPHGYGLTAIIGLSIDQIESLCYQVNDVYIANINAERQIVIAGNDHSMAMIVKKALNMGAQKVHRLDINVPSHCKLLDETAHQLMSEFTNVTLTRPKCAYLSGTTGRVLWNTELIADDLAMNMSRTIHWHDAMVAANERGIRLAIEVPPGNTLTQLTKQAFCQGEAISLEQMGTTHIIRLCRHLTEDC